eukprot:scaffold42286_cov36-Prasinocladus_malaysianus.AAC.1
MNPFDTLSLTANSCHVLLCKYKCSHAAPSKPLSSALAIKKGKLPVASYFPSSQLRATPPTTHCVCASATVVGINLHRRGPCLALEPRHCRFDVDQQLSNH